MLHAAFHLFLLTGVERTRIRAAKIAAHAAGYRYAGRIVVAAFRAGKAFTGTLKLAGKTAPIDECYECGFTGEFECTSKGFTCPKCGNHDAARVSVTRRVCGYLGSPGHGTYPICPFPKCFTRRFTSSCLPALNGRASGLPR